MSHMYIVISLLFRILSPFFLSMKNQYTVIYRQLLIITLNMKKCSATKRGWLLNLCGEPEQWHLYGTYVVKTSSVI